MADRSPRGDRRAGLASAESPDWPRPSLAVDVVALTVSVDRLQVLVHRRTLAPYAGELALPGAFLEENEPAEDAARRALKLKGNLAFDGALNLVSVENHPDRRDPRGWVMTVVYLAVVPWWELQEAIEEAAGGGVAATGVRLLDVQVPWRDALGEPVNVSTLAGERIDLPYDHAYLIGKALAWLRHETWRSGLPLELARKRFTLRELQDVYEAILGEDLFRTTFRRRMVDTLGLIEPTGEVVEANPRQPELFRRSR